MARSATRNRLTSGGLIKRLDTGATSSPGGTGPVAVAGQVFAPSSFWYEDVRNAPLHSNSAAIVSAMNADRLAYYNGDVTMNTTGYAMPIYVATPQTPRVNVGFINHQGKNVAGDSFVQNLMTVQWRNVPLDPSWRPADGTDSEMGVYDPVTDQLWEFWLAEYNATPRGGDSLRFTNGATSHNLYACWGGRMDNLKTSQGIFTFPFGTAATGLPFIGGQVSIAEGQAAAAGDINAIKHAIGYAMVTPRGGNQSWPANRNDGFGSNSNLPYEGQRFRLPSSLNVATMPGNNFQKAIARAIQVYGLVIWDKAGSASLRAENPKRVTVQGQSDPWPSIFGGLPSYAVGNQIPWAQLQALPFDYGKP